MKIKVVDNKVVESIEITRRSVDWYEDVVRLRAQADKLEAAAKQIKALESTLKPEVIPIEDPIEEVTKNGN